jgi:hypothetical protein
MTIGELGTLAGFAALLLNAGVQWGLQLAARQQNEKDHERLEKAVAACRDDSALAISAKTSFGSQQLALVTKDVETIGDKIDRGFGELKDAISTVTNRLVEHEVRLKNVEALLANRK